MPTWDELQQFLVSAHPHRLRDDLALEQTHWATTRVGDWPHLTVLAMDHRSQFEALCEQTGADPARIPKFKALAPHLDAVCIPGQLDRLRRKLHATGGAVADRVDDPLRTEFEQVEQDRGDVGRSRREQ